MSSFENVIAIDIETFDPNLLELGNGAIRKDGYPLTISIADAETEICFNPNNHHDMNHLRRLLSNPNIVKVAHNGVYDYDWLQNGMGLEIKGRMEDTMTRQGLINEYGGHYDLNSCCLREGIKGKNEEDTIEAWWKRKGGTGKAVSNLPLIPFEIIAEYNMQDARATFDLYKAQQSKLDSMELHGANDIEVDQYPLILEMRKNGIKIDVPKIDEVREQVTKEVAIAMERMYHEYGLESITTKKGPGSLPYVLQSLGVTEGMLSTPTGELSTAYNSLVRCLHPIAAEVIEIRKKNTLLTKYLNSAFVKYLIGDRIHGTFKPTQRDDGGTITGRYSSSDPNMQNFTSNRAKGGELVRGVFIPDDDHLIFKLDYEQIEYKLLAHYAIGPGSMQLRENMMHGADYHQLVQDMLGWSGPDARKRTKVFNFGMIYGMGLKRFKENFELEARETASSMGMTTDQYTEHFYKEYMRRLTYVQPTTRGICALAQEQGAIRSVGGRLHRLPPDGGIYKMPNYLIQGGAADINKMGLRDAWKAGVFNVLKLALTVHDEVVGSVPITREGFEALRELEHCMTNCVKLKVPITASPSVGINWYEADGKPGKELYSNYYSKLVA